MRSSLGISRPLSMAAFSLSPTSNGIMPSCWRRPASSGLIISPGLATTVSFFTYTLPFLISYGIFSFPNTLSMGPGEMPVSPSGITISLSATWPGFAGIGTFSDSIILASLNGFILVKRSIVLPVRNGSILSLSRPAFSAALSISLFFVTLNTTFFLNFFLMSCTCFVGIAVRSAMPTTGYFLKSSENSLTTLIFHSGILLSFLA